MRAAHNILFISYDGLSEYLGQSQVLPYMVGIAKRNSGCWKITMLTYEKPEFIVDKLKVNRLRQILDGAGVQWISAKYHKRPKILSTIFDVFLGTFISLGLIKRNQIGIVHARSYVSALIGLFLKKALKKRFIFDMRGFWADERVEGGIWRRNSLYKIAKYFEKKFLLNADLIITLSENAKNEICSFRYWKKNSSNIFVIPTAADLRIFDRNSNQNMNENLKKTLNGKFVFVYIGALGTWYEIDGIYDFFRLARNFINNAHLLILTKQYELANLKIKEKNLDSALVTVTQAEHKDVPKYLNSANVGLAFYKPGYSRKGCCPTKIGEYLGCGLPVVINEGIGDMDRIIREENVGSVISNFNSFEYTKAINTIQDLLKETPVLRQRCRAVAEKYFSLDKGIERYLEVYQKILKI